MFMGLGVKEGCLQYGGKICYFDYDNVLKWLYCLF